MKQFNYKSLSRADLQGLGKELNDAEKIKIQSEIMMACYQRLVMDIKSMKDYELQDIMDNGGCEIEMNLIITPLNDEENRI